MDIIFSMLISFSVLIFSIYKGIFVGYPLFFSFLTFSLVAWKRGFSIKAIAKMSYAGGRKAFVVLKVFVLIGSITGIWMASGTVPAIVYYGIQYMNPSYFILYAFLISSVVSFLLGTALGTVSTVGIALILMAKSGNVHIGIATGAIMAGAYFGDRCSPMSSSANLVANLTETNLHSNIRNMFKTSLIPFILSIVIYFILSHQEPLTFVGNRIDSEIINVFIINWVVLLPAIIILIFSIIKLNVKLSMLVSIVTASFIAVHLQGYTFLDVLKFILLGFHLEISSPLRNIIKGGGIISMWKASLVVFISCSLAGIFDTTNLLGKVESILRNAKTRYDLFVYTVIMSIITAALGCNQSISIVLTNQLMEKSYSDKNQLAIDLENTAVLLAALIPWNIAAFVPTTTLEVSNTSFIPYAFYLYFVPIYNMIFLKISQVRDKKAMID